MTNQWEQTINYFISQTDGSFLMARTVFMFHDDRMNNSVSIDVRIADAYKLTHPFFIKYDQAYSFWDSLRGSNPSNTQSIVDLIDELSSTLIRNWDIRIQSIYDIKTSMYKKLMPNRRIPFQTGTFAVREDAVKYLIAAIGNDAKLASVKTEVQSFLDSLIAAKTAQSNQLADIDKAVNDLEAARKLCADYLYYNKGVLMQVYFQNTSMIDNFYPVDLLISKVQTYFTVTLNDQKPKRVVKRKFDVQKQKLKVTNKGDFPILLFFTNGLTDVPAPGTPVLTVPAKTTDIYDFQSMNYTDKLRFLYVQYTGTYTTEVDLEIVKI